MINKIARRVSFFSALLTIVAIAVFFYTAYTAAPHVSELAFIESSNNADVLGSVVPASCESAPPTNHFAGDCAVPPPPASLNVACGVPVNPPGPKTVSWPASARASYYMVRVDYPSDPAPHLVQNDSYAATSFQFTPVLDTNYTAWVHACNISGCSAPTFHNFNCPSPVVVDVSVAPARVDAGGSAAVDWTVTGANSCIASGGWSGQKLGAPAPENFTVTANTSYTLSCSGPGGTNITDTATIYVPSGFISAAACQIPIGGSSCLISVNWAAYDFFSAPTISQGTTTFSSSGAGPVARSVNVDNRTFMLRDSGGAFVRTAVADIQCATGSVWAGGSCVALPAIDIEANPDLIRSGNTAPIEIEILANYELTCTLSGGMNTTFTHVGALNTTPYSFTTRPLTSAQIVQISCVSPVYPQVTATEEERVSVVPTIQEI